MNEARINYKRLFVFGAISGLLWSLVPGYLSELIFRSVGQTTTVLITGILTGIAVSFLLSLPPAWMRMKGLIALGIVALPLGAFLFGFFISLLHKVVQLLTGHTYRFVEFQFVPVETGLRYAVYSVGSFLALILIPLALGTTILFSLIVIPE